MLVSFLSNINLILMNALLDWEDYSLVKHWTAHGKITTLITHSTGISIQVFNGVAPTSKRLAMVGLHRTE